MGEIWKKSALSGKICLILTALWVLVFSVWKVKFFSLDTSRSFCLFTMFWYFLCLTVSRQGKRALWMVAAIAAYLIYCYLPGEMISHMSRKNCMVAGVILCIAVLAPHSVKMNHKTSTDEK